jgi:hypothetical protein
MSDPEVEPNSRNAPRILLDRAAVSRFIYAVKSLVGGDYNADAALNPAGQNTDLYSCTALFQWHDICGLRGTCYDPECGDCRDQFAHGSLPQDDHSSVCYDHVGIGARVPLGRIAGGRAACQCSRLLSGGLRRLNGMERHAMEAWALPYLRASNMRQEPHKSLCR